MYDISENKAEKIFQEYIQSFDLRDERIRLKVKHTYHVVNIMDDLTKSLHLSKKNRDLAHTIALFHDIGRFEQIRTYHTFIDSQSIDHGDFGCIVLEKNNMLMEEDKEIVLCAIHNHNKFSIEPGLDKRTLLMCRLIRDADKADIFRVFAEQDYPTLFGITKEAIENSLVSMAVKDCLMHHQCVKKEDRKTGIDFCLTFIGFFYDFYFDETIKRVLEKKEYLLPFQSFGFTHEQTCKDIKDIFQELYSYLKNKRNLF